MSTTITHSTGVIAPIAVDGWTDRTETRTLFHPILGRSDVEVTFRPPALRSGTMSLVFATAGDAASARAALLVPQVLTLASTDQPILNMAFVIADGNVSSALGEAGEWTLDVPFMEVLP